MRTLVVGSGCSEGKLPEGWALHVAGPTENGWRVVNVVQSQEQFETFARERLIPTTQRVGDPPPEVEFFPIYNLIRDVD